MNDLAWLTDAVARTAQHPGRAQDVATVQWECGSGPDGPVQVWWRVEGGRVVEATAGTSRAECTMTLPYEQADAVARGEADPAVLFMQGIAKTTGDSGAVLRVLPAACASARLS